MEHTGVYALPLCSTLSDKKLLCTLVPALEIQRSCGIQRGKSDKSDARLIAQYAYLRRASNEKYLYCPIDFVIECTSWLKTSFIFLRNKLKVVFNYSTIDSIASLFYPSHILECI